MQLRRRGEEEEEEGEVGRKKGMPSLPIMYCSLTIPKSRPSLGNAWMF